MASNLFLWPFSRAASSGDTLTFYDVGTTTPKNVYAETGLSTSLGSTLSGADAADANGKFRQCYLQNSAYTVVWYSSTGTEKGRSDTYSRLTNFDTPGDLDMNGRSITALAAPSASTDAARKSYVDTMLPLAGGTLTGSLLGRKIASHSSLAYGATTTEIVQVIGGKNDLSDNGYVKSYGWEIDANGTSSDATLNFCYFSAYSITSSGYAIPSTKSGTLFSVGKTTLNFDNAVSVGFGQPLRGIIYGTILNPGTLTLGTLQSGLISVYGSTGTGGFEFNDIVNFIVGYRDVVSSVNNSGCATRTYGQDGSGYLTVSLSTGAALTYTIQAISLRG
jgi:hypothetical protein